MKLVAPAVTPPLDEGFRPAVLANHAFLEEVAASGTGVPLAIALERNDGITSVYRTQVFGPGAGRDAANSMYVERLVKFLLWQRGGWKITIGGNPQIAAELQTAYAPGGVKAFDANLMGVDVYEQPFTVQSADIDKMPEEAEQTMSIGGHLQGCRVGFDLGASDRKASAVMDGEVVFSEEVEWDPKGQSDPQYHWDGVMDSIKRAAEHLPRLDGIGGSAAGIYIDNRAKVASLFRGISKEDFNARIKDMFINIGKALGAPLVVVNDGDVTALAGGMELEDVGILGIAMGSSEAGGYLDTSGHINGWLNELAFCPIDYNPQAAVDEWSEDYGCGAKYFSQQAVARLVGPAGIGAADGTEEGMGEPEILKVVQELHTKGDERAVKILETIGVWLGYAIAHYADFYEIKHVLVLGRVTSGEGGPTMLREAQKVLKQDFPTLAQQISLHLPDEANRRVGQAIAAASLPELSERTG